MNEEVVYEILAPDAAMVALLEESKAVAAELAERPRGGIEALPLEKLDAAGFVDALAQLCAARRGFSLAREDAVEDLRLWCSETLGIMAPRDAVELFEQTLVEHPLERLWSRVTTPATTVELFRADLGRGWSGFESERTKEEKARLTRLRMFCDRHRGTNAHLRLKIVPIVEAALFVKTFELLELFEGAQLARARERVALELVVRYDDWAHVARALAFADAFAALDTGDTHAASLALKRTIADVDDVLGRDFLRRPWQRIAAEPFPPVCTEKGHTNSSR